jgi:hypothetical protein
MSQQPLDDNYKPIDANLYDASGNQYVSPMAGTVTTDSGGEKYAPHVVSVGDGTTPTQLLAIDSSGNASVKIATGTAVVGTVEIGDGTTPTQKLAVSATGEASVDVVNIGGAAAPIGAGLEATAVRVTLPTDGTGVVGLNTGSNVIGTIELGDGTTPTQKLAVSATGEASVDVAKISGAAVPLGHGLAATAIRVELPTDGTGVVGLNAGSNLVGGVEIYDGAGVNKLAVSAAGEASVDVAKLGGAAVPLGHGLAATALRVELPTDGTGVVGLNAGANLIGGAKLVDTGGTNELAISAAGEASVDVTKMGGAAVPLGHGLAATAIRVELPTDGTGVVGLNAGSNLVGGVEIYDGAGVNKLAVSAAGEASTDIKMVGGSALALGQAAMAASVPVVVASDQSNLPANVAQIGGSALALGQAAMAASLPVALASDQSDVGVAPHATATGGATPYHLSSAASNNATNLKGTAGNLYGYAIHNTSVGAIFTKFYNKATAPDPAADAALITWIVRIPAGEQVIGKFTVPIWFDTGLGFATVTGAGDTDNTAVGAGDLILNIIYK